MTQPLTEAQRSRLVLARLDAHEVAPDRRVEWAAYQGVLLAVGIDPVTLDWAGKRYDAEDVIERWIKPNSASWNYLHRAVPGFPSLTAARWSPIYALGFALRNMFGLRHYSKQNTGHYVIDALYLTNRRLATREENMLSKPDQDREIIRSTTADDLKDDQENDSLPDSITRNIRRGITPEQLEEGRDE